MFRPKVPPSKANNKEADFATNDRNINGNWILKELVPNLVYRQVVPLSGTKFAYSVIFVLISQLQQKFFLAK